MGPYDTTYRQSRIPGLMYRMHMSKIVNEKSLKFGVLESYKENLYVEDFSDSINFLINTEWEEDLINIGSGEEISIKQLAELLKEITEYKGVLEFDDTKPDGNPRKLLDSIFERFKPKPFK